MHRKNGKQTRGRTADGQANPIDRHVGQRIRLRRTLLGLSQEQLAERIGLTFQQVQKYERGCNRVSASRMFDLSCALEVPVSFFFDGMDGATAAASPARLRAEDGPAQVPAPPETSPLVRRESLELLRAYYGIGDHNARRRIYDLIKAMADTGASTASSGDRRTAT